MQRNEVALRERYQRSPRPIDGAWMLRHTHDPRSKTDPSPWHLLQTQGADAIDT